MSENSNDSWSTSDDNSSGNEYSVKTKEDKKDEESKTRKKKHKHNHKHKKYKRKHKKNKKKHKKKDTHEESDSEGSTDNDDSIVETNNQEHKTITSTQTPINILPALLNNPSKNKKECNKTVNILPAILNRGSFQNKNSSKLNTGSDLFQDIMKVINDQDVKKEEIKNSLNKSKTSTSPKRTLKDQSSNLSSKAIQSKRSRSKSKDRKKKKSHSRSRSRSHRSRSRSKSRRKKSHNRSRSKSRNRSKSHSRERRHSRSRSKSRHTKTRHRSRSESRNRSRSHGKRASRSRSRSRHRSSRQRSRSRSRNTNTYNRSRSKTRSNWDLTYVPSDKKIYQQHIPSSSHHRRQSRSSSRHRREKSVERRTKENEARLNSSVFTGSAVNLKRSIDIKIPDSLIVQNKPPPPTTEEKQTLYGKWESYKSDTKAPQDLDNLTKLCQTISAKEGVNGMDIVDEEMEAGDEKKEEEVHHPFKVSDAPMYAPSKYHQHHRHVPTNPAQAIMAGTMLAIGCNPPITGPLESHFPVSSGTDHRKFEKSKFGVETDANAPVFQPPPSRPEEKIDVSTVIARRLGAQQILTKDPTDYSAQLVLAECDLKLKRWSTQSKKPGKFTGEIGTRLNQSEIAGAIETWVRKDFFHNLTPISGGVGQRMMEKMGWSAGTPLGRNNEGYIAPISIDVKVGRVGLHSAEEQPASKRGGGGGYGKMKGRTFAVSNINGKHPVSVLAEVCTKRRLGVPAYDVVFEGGQSHSKNFLMKVTIQNIDYQSSVASPNKKHAKAQAAQTALQILGIVKE